MTLTVGQTLWYVPTQPRDHPGYEVVIKKIGRRWAYLNDRNARGGRIDVNSLTADGWDYTFPGQCYLTQAHYLNEIQVDKAWHNFCVTVGRTYHHPNGLTLEKIRAARATLGLPEGP